jgi:hypothetical protein
MIWMAACRDYDSWLIDSSAVKLRLGFGRKGGRTKISRSRGGRTGKMHALTDAAYRPRFLVLTGD